MDNIALTRRGLLSLGPALLVATRARGAPIPPLFAVDPLSGLALDGYDPVSYALPGGPLPGRAGCELAWSGLTWRFVGAANRTAFARDPEVYAPRLGGYDARGVAEGRLVEADPLVPLRSGQRLYLFRNAARRDGAGAALLAAAEARWPDLRRRLGA